MQVCIYTYISKYLIHTCKINICELIWCLILGTTFELNITLFFKYIQCCISLAGTSKCVDKADEKWSIWEEKAKQHKHIYRGVKCNSYVFAVSVNFKSSVSF